MLNNIGGEKKNKPDLFKKKIRINEHKKKETNWTDKEPAMEKTIGYERTFMAGFAPKCGATLRP